MKQILAGLHEWSWWSEEKGLNFNGHALVRQGELIVIDPPPYGPGDREALLALGRPAEILLTNRHHVRASNEMRREFGARVWIHEADADALPEPADVTFDDEPRLPGGLRGIRVPDNKTPGETALWVPQEKGGVLILGDALIGKPAGSLRLLPDDKYADPARARHGVRVLLGLPYDAVLLGDGESIPSGGRAALERFLSTSY
jgi:hypothetical protein